MKPRTDEVAPPRMRITLWLGIVLIAAALAVLGWAAWETWGTNLSSRRAQDEIVREVERQWAAEEAKPSSDPAADGAMALVRIPRLGDDWVMPVLPGTSDKVLSEGLGHLDDTAGPGQQGNFAVAGHRVTNGEPFRQLPTLRSGDRVIVETRDTIYTYEVTNDGDALKVTSHAGWVLQPLPLNPEPGGVQPQQASGSRLLTLIACAEVFRTDDRLIVFGTLVDTQPR